MKIDYLKINGFGKIKNKEIKLEKNINLIYGKNESGKTTLLKFISSMLYGISRNKNGKEISDFEKYKPWVGDEFSGKLKYELDNKEEYEIFREFSKKNPKIYNKNLEDISKEFNSDKSKGIQFFYDQTKIDEKLFFATNLIEQNNVVLDNNNHNIITQKMANILSSGEDNISYKKVSANLSKKLIEEVGTERTVDRPINNIREELDKLYSIKKEFNKYSLESRELKNKEEEVAKDLLNIEEKLKIIKEIKELKSNQEKINEKININKSEKEKYTLKISNLKNELNKDNKKIKNNKINVLNLFFMSVLVFLNILINLINVSTIMQKIIIYSTIIYLLFNFIIYLKNKINNKNIEDIKLEKEIEVLDDNIKSKEKEINELELQLANESKFKIEEIGNKYSSIINKEEISNLFSEDLNKINNELDYLNKTYNNKRIELNTINIEEKNNEEKLEKKLEYDERIEYLENEMDSLHSLEKSINIAKEVLEESYKEMKSEITPKFTKNLSLLIEKISNGKYKKTSFDSDNGLIVEREDGEYINCNNLSIGTIDQLYLSLRLSAMNEISEENMPIILDETFAYFDNERLRNVLLFINEIYKNKQIIIFTCSNREKDILDKLDIKYNMINL